MNVGGKVTGSIIQTGDGNVASLHYQPASLPPPDKVDIAKELAGLKEKLARLESADRKKIDNALDEAREELTKPKPDKDEIGKALDRALEYGKKAQGFAKIVEELKPYVSNAAAWLGENWYKIVGAVGLVVK